MYGFIPGGGFLPFRRARRGHPEARKFPWVAHHFGYDWPIQFNVRTLEVLTAVRKPGDPGQSDAGGLYAYVFLQAHALTGEARYLAEAEAAIRALSDRAFDLNYQANLTSWGAIACLQLWRITGDDFYRDQSYVFLASFFHNTVLWDSQLGAAEHYNVFGGVTCLHDGPYLAPYECFESFAAFHECLTVGGDDLPDSVRLLLAEFCRYAFHRAWYFYPAELPEGAIATEFRNGHVDRALAFPVEDLYADGQPAGQVGQEVYGCGAAWTYVTRGYKWLPDAQPFLLFSEYPVHDRRWETDRSGAACGVTFRTRGAAGGIRGRVCFLSPDGSPVPKVAVCVTENGDEIPLPVTLPEPGRAEAWVEQGAEVTMRW